MKKTFSKETLRYYAVALLIAGLSNRFIFFFGHLLSRGARHWDLALPVDSCFPLVPCTIFLYLGVIPWCMIVYWVEALGERREADRFFGALLLTKAVSFLFFVFFPTSIARAEPEGHSLSFVLLRLLYRLDTPDNLFPSVHCLLAWLCWVGVRGKKEYPLLCRAAAFLAALAVCASTLTVRQHVLVDVFAGIALAELGYLAAGHERLRGSYAALSDRLTRLIFRDGTGKG